MTRVLVTPPLRPLTGNQEEHQVEGATVGEALRALSARYPQLASKLLAGDGSLRAQVIVYLEDKDIRLLEGDKTPVPAGSPIKLLVALAGG